MSSSPIRTEAPDDAHGRKRESLAFATGISIWPVHPGRTLACELEARGLSANELAVKLRVPANCLTEIFRGQCAISAESALRLGHPLGTGAAFRMMLQATLT